MQDRKDEGSTTKTILRQPIRNDSIKETNPPQPSTLRQPSSIHTMPDEILRLIFQFCVHMAWEEQGFQKTWPTPAWTVTGVCRHWRIVAIQTSRLWSYLQFRYPSSPATNRHIMLLGHSVDRSGSSPLKLDVKVEDEPDMRMTDDYIRELGTLLPRTRSLSYRLSPAGSYSGLRSHSGNFRALNTLELQGVEDFGDTFLNCRELRVVSIHFRSWKCWSSVRLPWLRLTSLTASACYSDDESWNDFGYFLGLLRRATTLEELQLMARMDRAFVGDSLRPINEEGALSVVHLERLSHLALALDVDFQRSWLPTVLRAFSFPNLSSVALNTLGGPLLSESASQLVPMVQKSKHRVTSLSLEISSSTGLEVLGNFLLSLSSVQTFSIKLVSGRNMGTPNITPREIARRLTLIDGRQAVFPLLTSLKLFVDGKSSQGSRLGRYLIDMLNSRSSPRLRLLALALNGKSDGKEKLIFTTTEQSNAISEYKEQGMYLSLPGDSSSSTSAPELDWWRSLAV